MKVELTLPDGLVPEGSRIELRQCLIGGQYLHVGNQTFVETCSSDRELLRLVIIPPYQWPDCIPDGWWIAMDEDGSWYAFDREPIRRLCFFNTHDGSRHNLKWLNITLPTVTDWRQSKMQKPVKHA